MEATKQVLPNGLRVITIPKADSIATTILVLVEAGSKYESKAISGLSHFLEHMCFKGTTKRPKSIDISAEFDSLGAQYNAFTSQEYTGYWVTVQPKFTDRALDLITDMYLNPTFPEAEMEKEKGVIIEEINMYEDTPMRHVGDLFMELLYGNQPAGWNIAGTRESVRGMKRADFVNYRAQHYVASATTVVVAGQIPANFLKQLEQSFSLISVGAKNAKLPVQEEQKTPAVKLEFKKSDQTHLVLGFRTLPISHADNYILEVLAAVLGGGMSSRLFRRIREDLGAAYYVRAYNDAFTDHGFLGVSVGADNKRVLEIIKVITAECARLTKEAVGADELRRVKDALIGNLYLGLETSSNLANFYGGQEVLKHEILSPTALAGKLEQVTAGEIQRVAQTFFTKPRLNLALIGPSQDASPFVALLNL